MRPRYIPRHFAFAESWGLGAKAMTRWILFGVAAAAFALPGKLIAEDTRDFTILVDGKPQGEYHLTIAKQDDGSFVVQSHAKVRISYLIKTYRYSYRGQETWKDNHLVRFDSSTNDDGKQYEVVAVAQGRQIQVQVNGQSRVVAPDLWISTYWQQPHGQPRHQKIAILDGDTGEVIPSKLHFVGIEQRTVAGQVQNCAHYRVYDGMQADLWYDAQGLLVHEDAIDDGHRVVHELVRVREQ